MTSLPRKPRILIVDDDESICQMLRTFFEAVGYEVGVCMSPLSLVRDVGLLRADLILLDVMMSWVDGFRLCELLKENPATRDIPVVMMSARAGQEDIRRGLAQAEDYIVKPFSLAALRGRVDELLTVRQGTLPN